MDISKLHTRKVCFFKLKDGKYLDKNGEEVTTEMLNKYFNVITENFSYILFD